MEVSRREEGTYLQSKLLGMYDFVLHAFGTRRTGDDEKRVAAFFNISSNCFFTGKQVHGGRVIVLDESGHKDAPCEKLCCDGFVSDRRGVALGVRTADCVPILFLDPVQRVIGAVHAGWKGTALGIAAKAVGIFVERFSSDPADVRAVIGPAIGSCCYEVDSPVFQAMKSFEWADSIFTNGRKKGHWMLDLGNANRLQMIEAGLSSENIAELSLCTACRRDLFFSYRSEGDGAGRQLSFIMLK